MCNSSPVSGFKVLRQVSRIRERGSKLFLYFFPLLGHMSPLAFYEIFRSKMILLSLAETFIACGVFC